MSNQVTTVEKNTTERAVEFTPFGAADKIKLTVKIVQNIVAVPTKSGRSCSERDAMKFILLCQAQRLNPFAGDAFLVGYDGQNGPTFSLITAHQAFLKRAENCPQYDGMVSGIIVQDDAGNVSEIEGDFHLPEQKVIGGWARVFHKGRSKQTYRRIRMERFNNGFAQWKVDGPGMICKCAEADALRSTFPTLLGGLYIEGEQERRPIELASTVSGGTLVQVAGEIASPAQDAPITVAEPTPPTPASESLAALVSEFLAGIGVSYEDFCKFVEGEGIIPNATSFPSLDDWPAKDLKRMLTAKVGLSKGLKEAGVAK